MPKDVQNGIVVFYMFYYVVALKTSYQTNIFNITIDDVIFFKKSLSNAHEYVHEYVAMFKIILT